MAKSSTFDNDLLKLIFNATPIANVADNAATSPLTSLYVTLHTADPGVGGTMATSEIGYTGYARQGVLRTTGAGGWTVSGASVSPFTAISFPQMSAGAGGIATFWSVGVNATVGNASKILYSGAISPTINVQSGVTPQLTTASTITES